MKNKPFLYSAFTYYGQQNLGDFVQTLAAMQFLPKVDYFVHREEMMRSSAKPPSFLIANGWYMHHMENFPPPKNIRPFYVSVHIESPAMLSEKTIDHFKEHQPIGCRDQHTFDLLKSKGIAVYFSNCLTLTLKNKFKKRNDAIYFIDLDKSILSKIPEEIRRKAVFVSHNLIGEEKRFLKIIDRISPNIITNMRLRKARRILDLYAQAKLVITNRLHVTFPCWAFQTPVILFKNKNAYSPSRFTDLGESHNCYSPEKVNGINWNPTNPDITGEATFLSNLVTKAVEIQDNPLKHYNIKDFCPDSWMPDRNF